MDATVVALSLLTGLLAGAVFAALRVPIPAPPNLAGVIGIVGIYLGYQIVQLADVGVDLVKLLGL